MKLKCPICAYEADKFSTYAGRKNARCPKCGAMERHRLLWQYLGWATNLFEGHYRVLDVAHMEAIANRLRPLLSYKTVDIDPGRHPDMVLDITAMALPDASFDVIFCYHVLEHIWDDCAAMRELYRVLAPGGWAILQSPVEFSRAITYEDPSKKTRSQRKHAFKDPDHVRIYGRDYQHRLELAGFEVVLDDFVKEIPVMWVKLYALDPDELIWLCKKPKRRKKMQMTRKEILEMFAERAPEMIATWPEDAKPEEIPQHLKTGFTRHLIKAVADEKKITSVLDFGCGLGRWAKFWLEYVGVNRYTGIEPVEPLAREAERRIEPLNDAEIMLGEITKIEESMGHRWWDVGFTFTALEHVPPEDVVGVAEVLKRRTKRLILIEAVQGDCFGKYTFKHDYEKLFGPWDHSTMLDANKALMIWDGNAA